MALKSARAKGKNGELEACHTLKELFGWVARRTQQFSGWAKGGDSAEHRLRPDAIAFLRGQARRAPCDTKSNGAGGAAGRA